MSGKGPSRLGAGLIARKGEAAPSPAIEALTPVSAPPSASGTAPAVPRGTLGTIAVTVRLDAERYERMKIHGVRRRLSNQEILVKALDAYLSANAE